MYGLSAKKSGRYREVAVIGGSNEQQVYIAQRLPRKCDLYMYVCVELSHEVTEFHPQTNQPDKKKTSSDILLS